VRFGNIFLVSMAFLLTACATTPPLTGENLAVLPITELPPPAGDAREYHVGAFDKLEVDVFGVEELARREVQTDASGRLAFPLAGSIDANGLTLRELSDQLAIRLAHYVKNPQVTVNLKEAVSQFVTVDGEVREPGLYPVVGDLTLMRAIARAKGATEYARMESVVVFRTVKNQKMAALYNLGAIRNGQYADPQLYANDVVIVGDSPKRRMFRDILSAAPLLTTPLIILFQ
jgi:polysaccharide export outer membrane protein